VTPRGGQGPMPISFRRTPAPPTTRSIVVDGRQLRIDVRPGTGRTPPLLLVNGVGASLELLQPFVDALDPALEVIRFDAPGDGGSARSQPDRISELMHAENRVGPALGYVYQLAAGAGWTSLPFLPLIRQPTLILSGDDDPLIPLANARLMHSLIPRSQLHVYH